MLILMFSELFDSEVQNGLASLIIEFGKIKDTTKHSTEAKLLIFRLVSYHAISATLIIFSSNINGDWQQKGKYT